MRWLGRVIAGTAVVGFSIVAYIYLALPDVRILRALNPDTTAFIDLRSTESAAKGQEPRRVQRWVSYARMSANLRRAVLVAEDDAFFEHDGLDFVQLRESIELNLERGEWARGASTITQQLAKNLYLSPSRDPVRKLRELLIARRLEAELGKQRILELYLNVIEWGDGIYGAEAASRTYFGKSAAALSREEAALLAAAIINPRRYSPATPNARLKRRQQIILARMGGRRSPPSVVPAGRPSQPPDASKPESEPSVEATPVQPDDPHVSATPDPPADPPPPAR